MPEPNFEELHRHLSNAGVAPKYVRRIVDELRDHYHDLQRDIVEKGLPAQEAAIVASRQLGALDVIAKQVKNHRELRQWSYRYPTVGRIVLPLLCVAALPIAPIAAGINHAHALVRWGAIITLSAVITASLFLAMQISISLD